MADPPQLRRPLLPVNRKINGKTHTTLLTAEQMDRYRPWFDNAKKIRSLTANLEALCLEIANATEELDMTPNAAGSRFNRKLKLSPASVMGPPVRQCDGTGSGVSVSAWG